MDFSAIRARAQQILPEATWNYFNGTALGDVDHDVRQWSRWDLVPRVLTGITSIDTTVTIGSDTVAAPIVLAPSASQGAAHPDGELATRRAAAATGLLAGYSFHATVEVERFADAADSPWWAQAYVMEDRSISDGYLRRCAAAGASVAVLTVDVPGSLADAAFRRIPMSAPVAKRGNYPKQADGTPIPVLTEPCLNPSEIERTADISGLPVWVKGIMTAEDAHRAIEAGAAGIYVSNHARRQLPGVAPTVAVLPSIVEAVSGRTPIAVDGGIRGGVDVARALALGAGAVAIGRPIPWALAAGGQDALEATLRTIIDELRVTMAALGAGDVASIAPGMVQPAS